MSRTLLHGLVRFASYGVLSLVGLHYLRGRRWFHYQDECALLINVLAIAAFEGATWRTHHSHKKVINKELLEKTKKECEEQWKKLESLIEGSAKR